MIKGETRASGKIITNWQRINLLTTFCCNEGLSAYISTLQIANKYTQFPNFKDWLLPVTNQWVGQGVKHPFPQ